MKKFTKVIASVLAGVMAAMALAATASAAEYYDVDGTCWTDNINDGNVYIEDNYGYYNDGYYVGYDVLLDDIYLTNTGYYSISDDVATYLGKNFAFTNYIGTDRFGRAIYYRSECGYMYYEDDTWYSLGYNINNIDW